MERLPEEERETVLPEEREALPEPERTPEPAEREPLLTEREPLLTEEPLDEEDEERVAPEFVRTALEEEREAPEDERTAEPFARVAEELFREPERLARTAEPERLWLERETLVRPLREAEAERTAAALRLMPAPLAERVTELPRPVRRAVVDSEPIGVWRLLLAMSLREPQVRFHPP